MPNYPVCTPQLQENLASFYTIIFRYTNHSTRGTGITLLTENGYQLYEVRHISRHKTVKGMQSYVRTSKKTRLEMANSLSSTIFRTKSSGKHFFVSLKRYEADIQKAPLSVHVHLAQLNRDLRGKLFLLPTFLHLRQLLLNHHRCSPTAFSMDQSMFIQEPDFMKHRDQLRNRYLAQFFLFWFIFYFCFPFLFWNIV